MKKINLIDFENHPHHSFVISILAYVMLLPIALMLFPIITLYAVISDIFSVNVLEEDADENCKQTDNY